MTRRSLRPRASAWLSICAPCVAQVYLMHSLIFHPSQIVMDYSSISARESPTKRCVQSKVLLEKSVPTFFRIRRMIDSPPHGSYHKIALRILATHILVLVRTTARILRNDRANRASLRVAPSTKRNKRVLPVTAHSCVSPWLPAATAGIEGRRPRVLPELPR